ncbi:hypothetical protein FOL47_011256 [Perkinsus chesapeaki]|uniref:Ectonucleotide pyrophosphatase phosphodiesterase n=1 Tax=Perkinsus chesapeaki TaxID=330153 RepID=A0A7J6MMX4_PERCH|nr:hypothetical protein FOL47_011256 [Perkinsus chesapeaki]
MIGIDGFGGEYLKNVSKAIAPTMKGLLDSGKCAYSFSARAQLPTVSAPNWASILTGMSPSETGIIGNEWNTTCLKPTSLTDGCVAPLSGAGFGNDTSVTDFVRDLVLSTDKPHVTFLHIDAVDHAGHSTFWGSSVYYEAVKKADGYVGQITAAMNKAAISDNTLLVITADHGGYRDTHEIWDSATANTPVLFCNTAGKIKSPGLMELPVVNVDPNAAFERVIMIGIDGLGGEYLKNVSDATAPTIKGLLDSGKCAYSFSVRAQLPTVSGPNWASILTGTLPPTIFHLGKAFSANLKTASAYGWPWIGELSGNDVDYEKNGKMQDTHTVKFVRDLILSTNKPHITFLHIEEVDSAGHGTYWGSPEYYKALTKADGYVKEITAAMDKAAISDTTLLVITADHGGIGNNHVEWTTATANTPVLFCNKAGKIKSTGLIERSIVDVDYLPTIMGALGIPITPYQRGQDHSYLFVKTSTTDKAPMYF